MTEKLKTSGTHHQRKLWFKNQTKSKGTEKQIKNKPKYVNANKNAKHG